MSKEMIVNKFYEIIISDEQSAYSDSFDFFVERVCKARDEGKITEDDLKFLVKIGVNKMVNAEIKQSKKFVFSGMHERKKKTSIFLKYLEMQHGRA